MTPTEAVTFVEEVLPPLWPNVRFADNTADAWYTAGLKNVTWDDALDAAKHLVTITPFVSLAELMAEVKRQREIRLAARPLPAPHPDLANNPPAYRDQVQANVKQIADRLQVDRRALPPTGSGAPPSAEYNQLRGADRDPVRVAALQVSCPWEPCKSSVGTACRDARGHRLKAPAHDGRLVAAGLADWVTVNGVRRAVMRGWEASA